MEKLKTLARPRTRAPRSLALLGAFLLSASRCVAEVSVASPFTSHMVLQRETARTRLGNGRGR